MVNGKNLFIFLIFLVAVAPLTTAIDVDHILSNSEDWKDVYSILNYANLQEIDSDFLTSTNHGKIILNGINKNKEIRVITSSEAPYVFSYPEFIKSEGFSDSDEIVVRNANLELINELPGINNFIIVDNSYGYNPIAVTPYAIQTNSWVFLANNLNIDQIDSILSQRNVDKILIYGYVDREVRDTMEKYNPETINNGDKFQDNIDITKKFFDIKSTTQILLTNGDFIEKEIMAGNGPILFTGRENVPTQIAEYIKGSQIEIGVLIGNELMGAATNIRRTTGISVMVKFARGARSSGDGISAVEGLDLFPLPSPSLLMGIDSIKYNKLTNQLEITYKSEANVPIYFKGTITIRTNDGNTKLGDLEPIFLTPGSYKTMTYSLDLGSATDIKATIYTLFGESANSMDRVLEAELDVDSIDVIDNCELEVTKVKYNKQNKEFIVYVDNIGDVDCWVNVELLDLEVGYERINIGSSTTLKVLAGKLRKIKIGQELNDDDLDKNSFVNVVANHGERENSLVKRFSGKFELSIESFTIMTYVIILIILIMLILIFLFFKRRKEEEEDSY